MEFSQVTDASVAWDFIALIVSGDLAVPGPACNGYLNKWLPCFNMCFQYHTSVSNEIVGEENYNPHL